MATDSSIVKAALRSLQAPSALDFPTQWNLSQLHPFCLGLKIRKGILLSNDFGSSIYLKQWPGQGAQNNLTLV